MVITTNFDGIEEALAHLGVAEVLQPDASALIKINLARPLKPEHPRTSPELIQAVVSEVLSHKASCAIAEGANGFLKENIRKIGLSDFVKDNNVQLIDLDLAEHVEAITIDNETHYLPRCLRTFDCRIAIPATTWLPENVFSNNVKLFVGAVPLRMYQIENNSSSRGRVHINLHKSIANIYRAVLKFCPFQFFVNGGKAKTRSAGMFTLPHVYVGNNALELDEKLLNEVEAEKPKYLDILKYKLTNQSKNNSLD